MRRSLIATVGIVLLASIPATTRGITCRTNADCPGTSVCIAFNGGTCFGDDLLQTEGFTNLPRVPPVVIHSSAPLTCGNGRVDPGEQCDRSTGNPCCTTLCTFATAGALCGGDAATCPGQCNGTGRCEDVGYALRVVAPANHATKPLQSVGIPVQVERECVADKTPRPATLATFTATGLPPPTEGFDPSEFSLIFTANGPRAALKGTVPPSAAGESPPAQKTWPIEFRATDTQGQTASATMDLEVAPLEANLETMITCSCHDEARNCDGYLVSKGPDPIPVINAALRSSGLEFIKHHSDMTPVIHQLRDDGSTETKQIAFQNTPGEITFANRDLASDAPLIVQPDESMAAWPVFALVGPGNLELNLDMPFSIDTNANENRSKQLSNECKAKTADKEVMCLDDSVLFSITVAYIGGQKPNLYQLEDVLDDCIDPGSVRGLEPANDCFVNNSSIRCAGSYAPPNTVVSFRAKLKPSCGMCSTVKNQATVRFQEDGGTLTFDSEEYKTNITSFRHCACDDPSCQQCEPCTQDTQCSQCQACQNGVCVDTGSCTECTGTDCGCGNGILQPTHGEECDDGNRVDTDGCTNRCKKPVCGDGILQPNTSTNNPTTNNPNRPDNTCNDPNRAVCGNNICEEDELEPCPNFEAFCDPLNGPCPQDCVEPTACTFGECQCGDGVCTELETRIWCPGCLEGADPATCRCHRVCEVDCGSLAIDGTPDPAVCLNDTRTCADGTQLQRQLPNCRFPSCGECQDNNLTASLLGQVADGSNDALCGNNICDPGEFVVCNGANPVCGLRCADCLSGGTCGDGICMHDEATVRCRRSVGVGEPCARVCPEDCGPLTVPSGGASAPEKPAPGIVAGGDDDPPAAGPTSKPPLCGDNVCEPDEDKIIGCKDQRCFKACERDCGDFTGSRCGNNTCEPGEFVPCGINIGNCGGSCPTDCQDANNPGNCGDGICTEAENGIVHVKCAEGAVCNPGMVCPEDCGPDTVQKPGDFTGGSTGGEFSGETTGDQLGDTAGDSESSGEECDDGSGNSDTAPNACRSDCRQARCGDGVLDTGENCATCPDDAGCANGECCEEQQCKSACTAGSCNDDGVCDDSESCNCRDCDGEASGCQDGVCDFASSSCTNSCGTGDQTCPEGQCCREQICSARCDSCDESQCDDGLTCDPQTNLCSARCGQEGSLGCGNGTCCQEGLCRTEGCGDDVGNCNSDGACDANESCACGDCLGVALADCRDGFVCGADGTCTGAEEDCGNGVVDDGETCATCPQDAGCNQGECCSAAVCSIQCSSGGPGNPSSCTNDDECPGDQECQDGICQPPTCGDDICETADGCKCIDCYGIQAGCADGLTCAIDGSGVCTDPDPQRCGNGAVDPGETCESCPADAGCQSGECCKDNQCTADCDLVGTCDNNGTCDVGETCTCPDCFGRQDSCDSRLVCSPLAAGTCVDACNSDGVCDADEGCGCPDCDGEVAGCTTGRCASDGSQRCTDPDATCNNDGTCQTIETCGCRDCINQPSACPDGAVCAADGSGRCVGECNNDGTCQDTERCSCSDCFGERSFCPSGTVCASDGQDACVGLCGNGIRNVGETCSTCPADAGCASGQCCSQGVCSTDCSDSSDPTTACNDNDVCEATDGCGCGDCFGQQHGCKPGLSCSQEGDGTCTGCTADSDCSDGICFNSQCVACPNGECKVCNSDADCRTGVCTNNRCVGCRDASDCASGQCVGGSCLLCRSGLECQTGVCITQQRRCAQCVTNEQCGAGRQCINGSCEGCVSDKDCVGGQQCTPDGLCTGCQDAADCPLGLCMNGSCTSCTSDHDCRAGFHCLNGECAVQGLASATFQDASFSRFDDASYGRGFGADYVGGIGPDYGGGYGGGYAGGYGGSFGGGYADGFRANLQGNAPHAAASNIAQGRPPVGDTGPAAILVMAAGAAAGAGWMRRRRSR